MGKSYLIDTNIAIYFLDGVLPLHTLPMMRPIFDDRNYSLSIITQIELLGWPFPDITKNEYAELFVSNSMILPLSQEVAEQTILLRKTFKIKPNRRTVPDAIIAATAMVFDLTLISRNDKDFKSLANLKYINPFD